MSRQFRKVHRPSLFHYRPIFITHALSKVFERLVTVRVRRFMERSGVHTFPSVLIGKVRVPGMHICAYPIHYKVHWRVGRT